MYTNMWIHICRYMDTDIQIYRYIQGDPKKRVK